MARSLSGSSRYGSLRPLDARRFRIRISGHFRNDERTTYHTPSMRVDAVKQFAERSSHVDSPEQRKLTDQLARQIQIEPDPIVRLAVVQTVAEFKTPMAQQVLEAGLSDDDDSVRVACCHELGNRAEATSIPKLTAVLRSDSSTDVRLAATTALGKMKSPEAIQAAGRGARRSRSGDAVRRRGGDEIGYRQGLRSKRRGTAPSSGRHTTTRESADDRQRVRGMSPFK